MDKAISSVLNFVAYGLGMAMMFNSLDIKYFFWTVKYV